MTKPKYNIVTLPRNNIKAALELAEYLMEHDQWTPEIAHMMLMTQDDPKELGAELEDMYERIKPKMVKPKVDGPGRVPS